MINYAWLIPALPLAGGLGAAVFARRLRQMAHVPVVAGIACAFVLSLLLLFRSDPSRTAIACDWLELSGLHVPIELRADALTTMMLAMVTFVATLIAVFAVGYMAGDPGYPRFFAFIGLFVFSMTGLVLSSNYLLTYVFWEGVGVCSYMLVGFWHAKPSAAAAAKKAFLVNRIGDFGFAIALFWLWSIMPEHGLSYNVVLDPETLGALDYDTKLGIALLLFWAATAKSAQIPLYVWLPDAMEGPTPVSALIHAATMVTAGVYLIARSSLLIVEVPEAQLVVAIIGCATALLAAAIALTQTDLKRVMAYSTVSQLGYMFMGLGAGIRGMTLFAVVAAMFHLFTHAFFKALLFLASGSVMHSMGGVIDMRRFRGLRHRMPITCWTFAVGGLALAGIPPFAGFFSKDEILNALGGASHAVDAVGRASWYGIYQAIYWVAVLTAFLTAFYTGRAFFLTFFGPEKLPAPDDPEAEPSEAHDMLAHAPAPAMPIDTPAPETASLAAYSSAMGTSGNLLGASAHGEADPHRPADLPPPTPGETDEPVPQTAHAHGHGHGHGGHDDHFGHESPPIMAVPLMVLAGCALLVGMVFGPTGWFEHHLARTPGLEELGLGEHGGWQTPVVGSLAGLLGLGLSWLLYAAPSPIPGRLAAGVRPLWQASRDKFYVDEIYDFLVVAPTRGLAALCAYLDLGLVDALVRGIALVPRWAGRNLLAPIQNGLIQFYAAATALGVAALLLILLFL